MHKAWLAAIAAGTLVATSSVAFAHGDRGGTSDLPAVPTLIHMALRSSTSASVDKPDADSDASATATAAGTVTAASSGTFSLQEKTPTGTQTVVVTYGASTTIHPASATIAVGDHVAARGTMSNGELVATDIAVAAPHAQPPAPMHPVHGTLASSVTLSVKTASGTQTVTLPAGTRVEVNPGGLHAQEAAASSTASGQAKSKEGND